MQIEARNVNIDEVLVMKSRLILKEGFGRISDNLIDKTRHDNVLGTSLAYLDRSARMTDTILCLESAIESILCLESVTDSIGGRHTC